jgi:hypothetical protein
MMSCFVCVCGFVCLFCFVRSSKGAHKSRLDSFLLYFQRYIMTKPYLHMDVEYSVLDTLDALTVDPSNDRDKKKSRGRRNRGRKEKDKNKAKRFPDCSWLDMQVWGDQRIYVHPNYVEPTGEPNHDHERVFFQLQLLVSHRKIGGRASEETPGA